MPQTDTAFVGRIPQLYDRLMVPMLFQPYAADMARRVSDLASGHILETAAGTGIVARTLATTLPRTVAIAATDLNQPMLDHAAVQPGAGRVQWRQADAQDLPFADRMFDAVICQFGVMFFPDKPRAFAEARRVLKPGGRFLFSVWEEIARSPIADIVTGAVAALFPADPPRFLARTPHGYHDTAAISSALRDAGFNSIHLERRVETSRAETARAAATAFCQGSPLRQEILARDADALDRATKAATRAVADRLAGGAPDTPVAAPMGAIIVSAARPG